MEIYFSSFINDKSYSGASYEGILHLPLRKFLTEFV